MVWLSTALLAAMLVPGAEPAESVTPSARRVRVPIPGGLVTVDVAGAVPISDSRVALLVGMADRGSCTTNVLGVRCDGFISPGDRILVTDTYMAFLDLTRSGDVHWGGGGGGLMRGFWLLHTDRSGNRNFRVLSNRRNWSPNLLLACQRAGCKGNGTADGHELIVLPEGARDPQGSYRASSGVPRLDVDGAADPVAGAVRYRISGYLNRGTTRYTPDLRNGSRLAYSIDYRFSTRAGTDVPSLVQQVVIRPVRGRTPELTTIVSSFGLSMDGSPVQVDHFEPLTGEAYGGDYNTNPVEPVCLHDRRVAYRPGALHRIPSPVGWAGIETKAPFSVREQRGGRPGKGLSYVVGSAVAFTGMVPLQHVHHQVIHDRNQATTYDLKLGSAGCAPVGSLAPGSAITITSHLDVSMR